MSAISNAGSSPPMQLIDQLRQRNGQDFQARMKQRFESAAKAAGVDPSKLPDLERQIQDAIAKARDGGQGDRQAVQAAVDGVLKNSGIDAAKFRSAMRAGGHHHRHGSAPGPDGAIADESGGAASPAGMGSLLDVAA